MSPRFPAALTEAAPVVIKIGTAQIFNEDTRQVRAGWMAQLAGDVVNLRAAGHEVTLVSSGAIALGRMKLGVTKPKNAMPVAEKQALAAVGQLELMRQWDKAFRPHGLAAAQLLLTQYDFRNGRNAALKRGFRDLARNLLGQRLVPEQESAKANIRNTLDALHGTPSIPIINENDATATAEIKFGDNDRLGALVAKLARARAYIILSDVEGLYTDNPQRNPAAQHIPVVERIDDAIRAMASGPLSSGSSGGMISKVEAAEIAGRAGCDTIICEGSPPNGLPPIAALLQGGKHTVFRALPQRPGWGATANGVILPVPPLM